MKTTFDYGNGIKITIDQNSSSDEDQFTPYAPKADFDAYDDYVDDNDYDDDDEQDEPVDRRGANCCSGYNAALDEAVKLREENLKLNHKIDLLRYELRRYFEAHSDGTDSEVFDPDYTAQEVVDRVADIVENW